MTREGRRGSAWVCEVVVRSLVRDIHSREVLDLVIERSVSEIGEQLRPTSPPQCA